MMPWLGKVNLPNVHENAIPTKGESPKWKKLEKSDQLIKIVKITKKGVPMQVDLEKKMGFYDTFEVIVKLSESYLDDDSTNNLKRYFDLLVAGECHEDEDDDSKKLVNTKTVINRLMFILPKRIERLLELRAPQVIIDNEVSALESIKKINSKIT